MNLFNCFQAMAFYTLSPLLAQWLFVNNYRTGGYIASVGIFIGYVLLAIKINGDDFK